MPVALRETGGQPDGSRASPDAYSRFGQPGRVLGWIAFALLCVFPLFFSLGDHPIHGDSEARYGVVARGMAMGETPLLVPTLFGEPHLTKPPLTYWLMAASIRLVGDGELALRLPAAISGVLTLAIVFGLAWRLYGPRRAAVAAAIVSVTPMFVVISRMGITDGPLGLFSTAALASGLLAVREGKRRWAVGLWASVALALLTKGPVGLLAPGALMLWLLITRQWEGWRRVRPIAGLPTALLPLIGWGLAVAWQYPEAWSVWRFQTLDRALGTGDHPEPWWFFFPVLAIGLLPATALLASQLRYQENTGAMNMVRGAGEQWLWAIMCLLTFTIFSLITGKLMSYLMPLVAPLAWWTTGLNFDINKCKNRINKILCSTVTAVFLTLWVGGFIVLQQTFGWAEAGMLWPAGLLLAIGVATTWTGGLRLGQARCWPAAVLWIAVLNAIAWACLAENRVFGRYSVPAAVEAVRQATGLEEPQILTVGFGDRSLPYYTNRPTGWIDPRVLDGVWAEMRKDDLVLLAVPEKWDAFDADPNWDLSQRFERVELEIKLGYEGRRLRVYRTTAEFRSPPPPP